MRARKAREKLKSRKARKKMKARKARKKMEVPTKQRQEGTQARKGRRNVEHVGS